MNQEAEFGPPARIYDHKITTPAEDSQGPSGGGEPLIDEGDEEEFDGPTNNQVLTSSNNSNEINLED